jgi:bifunctional DNA-binding transcriptional regulator/antitoxin component of YhaV-PrlF toxin-antitoxin module
MPTPTRDPGPVSFSARITNEGSHDAACWVVFPHDLKEMFGIGNLVPVVATFNGVEYRGSIGKMGPEARIIVRKEIRQKLGKQPGDVVDVTVVVDAQPRIAVIPPELSAALGTDPDAKRRFDAMPYSHQREYAQFVAEAKRDETRQRRANQAMAMIRQGRRRT